MELTELSVSNEGETGGKLVPCITKIYPQKGEWNYE